MLNQRIRELRKARHWSQVELADKLGISKKSLSNWENNNIQPSIEMLMRLASSLNVSTDHLLGMDERSFLEVSGLSDEELAHVQLIIDDIRSR